MLLKLEKWADRRSVEGPLELSPSWGEIRAICPALPNMGGLYCPLVGCAPKWFESINSGGNEVCERAIIRTMSTGKNRPTQLLEFLHSPSEVSGLDVLSILKTRAAKFRRTLGELGNRGVFLRLPYEDCELLSQTSHCEIL